MEDIHRVGGIPALLKYLLKHTDLIDGNQMTVTGKTLAQNLEEVEELEFDTQDVLRKLDNPLKKTGHLTILRGNLAPGTAVAKLTGQEGARFEVHSLFVISLCQSTHFLVFRVRPNALTGLFDSALATCTTESKEYRQALMDFTRLSKQVR